MSEQTTAMVFDISQFRAPKSYVWREIEREGEGREPLRVKLEDLTIQQSKELPWGMQVPLKQSYEAAAQYVVEWSLKAENIATGDVVPVPPPAEAGWEVFELLTNAEASAVINWLKVPQLMKAEEEKKSSEPSTTTSRRPKRKS